MEDGIKNSDEGQIQIFQLLADRRVNEVQFLNELTNDGEFTHSSI